MSDSSLLVVESAGVLLSALLVGWGGADVIALLVEGHRARRGNPPDPVEGRWLFTQIGPLWLVGIVVAVAVGLGDQAAPLPTMFGAVLVAFWSAVLLEIVEQERRAAAAAAATGEWEHGGSSSGLPRFAGELQWSVGVPMLELLVLYDLTGGNVSALLALPFGSIVGALAVRTLAAPRRVGPSRDPGQLPPRASHDAARLSAGMSLAVTAAVFVAAYAPDVRGVYAGALLLPVVLGCLVALSTRAAYATWGRDETRPVRSAWAARVSTLVVLVGFTVLLAEWALTVPGWWLPVTALAALVALAVTSFLTTWASPADGPKGDSTTGAVRSRLPAVLVAVVCLGAGAAAYLLDGFQAHWQSFFVLDLAAYGLGLFAVVSVAAWAAFAAASGLAVPGGSPQREGFPTAGRGTPALVATASLLSAGAAIGVGLPVAHGVAAATFLTWLTPANPSFIAGVLGGGFLAFLSWLPPLLRAWGRPTALRTPSVFGVGAVGTVVAGTLLGPSGGVGTLIAFALVGSALGAVVPSARPLVNGRDALRTPVSGAGGTFALDLMLASVATVGFAGWAFQHGLVVMP